MSHPCRLLFLVVVLATAPFAAGATKLLYIVRGQVFEVTACKGEKIWGRSDGDPVELPAGGAFSFSDDGWMNDDRVLLTPDFSVMRQSFPEMIEPYPKPYAIAVHVRNRPGWDDDGKISKASVLTRIWTAVPDTKTRAFVVWQAGTEPAKIVTEGLLPTSVGWFENTIHIEQFAASEQIRGRCGMLLLGPDGWIKPRPEFADPLAQAALHCLIIGDDAGFAERLSAAPASAKAKSTSGATLLHYAAQFGRASAIEPLKKTGADLSLALEDRDHTTPLSRAAELDQLAFVKRLLEAGAKPDAGDPLHTAIQFGHDDVAQALIAGGADVDRDSIFNESPLVLALNNDRGAMVQYLLDHKAPYQFQKQALGELLCAKATMGQTTIVRIMVQRGASPNSEAFGYTPLMAAAARGDAQMIAFLLKSGAKPSAVGKGHITPLMAATENGDTESVRLLLDAGASIASVNDNGAGVLHLAAASGNAATIALLLDRGASLGVKTKNGATPLTTALVRDNRAAVDMLFSRGARLDPKSALLGIEVDSAVRMDFPDLLEALIRDGWRPNSAVDGSWSISQAATLYKAKRCLALLEKESLLDHSQDITMAKAGSLTQPPVLKAAAKLSDPRPQSATLSPGVVLVEFIIDRDGRVALPHVVAADDDRLRGPTLAAVRSFQFKPALTAAGPAPLQVRQELEWQRPNRDEFELKEIDVPPVPTKTVTPEYPMAARRANVNATVKLEYIVTADGRVTGIRVVSSPHELFSDAAVRAVSMWRYTPGQKNGRPVNTMVAQSLVFSLTD